MEAILNKVSAIGPAWLLGGLLVALTLAVLLPPARAWLRRRKHQPTLAAQTALQQRPFDEAETTLLALLKKAKEKFGPDDAHVVRPMCELARLYQLHGRYNAAEPLLHRSLIIMEKADPENIEVSAVLEQLGALYEVQGRYEAAEPTLLRSLAIRERALGPNHPHVIPLLEQMAVMYRKLGRTGEARVFEERAKLAKGPS